LPELLLPPVERHLEIFASRITPPMLRPLSTCLNRRILSSLLYLLPFILSGPLGPRLTLPSEPKS
jgi:hypothetical protein